MTSVAVVDAARVTPSVNPNTGLSVRRTLGTQTGFQALEQAVLELDPGSSREIEVGDAEETLFVIDGTGTAEVGGERHALEPEVGLYLPPGSSFALRNPGPGTLRVVAVRVPDPEPPSDGGRPSRPALTRLADQEAEAATAQREFRIVADPQTGLRSATHFVGYIPTERAPDHFHTYDEVIYVLDGEGMMHAGETNQPLAPGSCIQLPARTVHCLENTGSEPMRVVAVFRPAGSPAAAYYPDGTPAQYPAAPQSVAGGWGCSSNQAPKEE
jgi:mannose-6-phosphate isomerase-like protein (cupin superfamily)